MKKSNAFLLLTLALVLSFSFSSCNKDDGNPDGVVSFTTLATTIDTDNLAPVTFTLGISPKAPSASTITIAVSASGGAAGTAFTTNPALSSGKIEVSVDKDATSASFTITPVEAGILYDDVEIDLEILSTGSGLKTNGIAGVFSSLTIENKKEQGRPIPYLESFGNCDDEGGEGGFPSGWEEVVATQNAQGTGHWRCAPGFDGFECNAFSEDGAEGDACEVWLVSPQIGLVSATSPKLSFMTDRRFDSDIVEYGCKISTDYDGSNFASATWTDFQPAIDKMAANDPDANDYESTGDLDLSAYAGKVITIAFIYYAEGSKFTATALRVDEVSVSE
jgi:hypothetical protein